MKVNRILPIFLLVVLAVPATAFIGWLLKEKTALNVLVVDKTVSKFNAEEHRSLYWVLNHYKFSHDKNKRYGYKTDYYGFFPIKSKTSKEYRVKSIRLDEIDSLIASNDAVYFTDTYGVFYADWYSGLGDIENSTLIYGGFNQNDFLLMNRCIEQGVPVIAEYNLLGPPTNPLVRYKTQDLLGIKYSGWTGKYFNRLSEKAGEVPAWIIVKYKKLYNKNWPYKQSGIILLHKDHVIVLEQHIHLNAAFPILNTASNFSSKYNIPNEMPFTGWFELIENTGGNAEFAWFKINTNALGTEILKRLNIKNEIPAILGNYTELKYLYFAGDFADNKISMQTYPFKGITKVKHLFYSRNSDDRRRFFWEYYRPMMEGVLNELAK